MRFMDKKTSKLEKLFGLWKNRSDKTSPCETVRLLRQARSFGMAKGELRYPDDIDFCNDEIAEMFGANA